MKRLCVYCGSKTGDLTEYRDAAIAFAHAMLDRQLDLVFGGGSIGLMGVLADEILARGGQVIGVIPRFLSSREVIHASVTQMHVVESMHTRKALMEQLADGFVALPGGLGTFEEILEILTWAQLGLHRKNIGLLNVRGFFDPLLAQIDRAIADGFVSPAHRGLFVVDEDPATLLQRLESHQLPQVKRWLTSEDEV